MGFSYKDNTNHFEVKAMENAKVRGLTNKDQGMHIDGIYFIENCPKIMTLFCKEQSENGGQSLFFDGLIGYQKLQKYYPKGLEALMTEELSMDLEMQGRHIDKKVFTQNENGRIEFFF